MPPSRHSSSSHSSHSSSSHSSSSRSSSSHSSSSRSYSSSSSRSSSFSRGPSSHSSTSHSSTPVFFSGSSRSSRRDDRSVPPSRPRVNQPMGFPAGGGRPYYVYGRRHDYVYYPTAWVDVSTGRSYEKGYYDENGQRYEDVAFAKNGRYENVMCHCPYCGQDAVMSPAANDAALQSLQCPSCGAPMEISSQLDEAVSSTRPEQTDFSSAKQRRSGSPLLIVLLVFVMLFIISSFAERRREAFYNIEPSYQYIETSSNLDLYGETIALKRIGDNAFAIVDSAGAADKELRWSEDDESYYDQESDCWLWYNTDVEPAIWQYWYEGISSDFGDYGWMEHDEDGWFIESSGGWIKLPDRYDASGLWYISD